MHCSLCESCGACFFTVQKQRGVLLTAELTTDMSRGVSDCQDPTEGGRRIDQVWQSARRPKIAACLL